MADKTTAMVVQRSIDNEAIYSPILDIGHRKRVESLQARHNKNLTSAEINALVRFCYMFAFANTIYLPYGKFDIILQTKLRYDINSFSRRVSDISHYEAIYRTKYIANSKGIYIATECHTGMHLFLHKNCPVPKLLKKCHPSLTI